MKLSSDDELSGCGFCQASDAKVALKRMQEFTKETFL